MPRTIYFEGRTIQVPDDFSDEEIRGILSEGAPPMQAAPKQAARASLGDPRFFAPTSSVAPGTRSAANTVDPRFLTTMDTPVAGGTSDPGSVDWNHVASRLGMSLFYASQQDPAQYARLLRIQELTGIPPIVSAGNEKEIEQWLDATRIDLHALTAVAPRVAAWAANPDNAAVAGARDIQRLGGVEQSAAAMRMAALQAASLRAAKTHAAAQNYSVTATNPHTQHQIGTNDRGRTWHDVQTGKRAY